jgi:nicotinamidase-related amidase
MKKITLIIVDFQKDFAFVNGKLAVAGADTARDAIVGFINKNADNIEEIIFTVDWHTAKHCSFKKNGGIWPVHCVQFTEGAGIDDAIMDACIEHNLTTKIFIKGNDDETEEYGAFEKMGTIMSINGSGYSISANNHKNDSPVIFDSTNVVVCGIAGDYCVLNTIKNLRKYKSPSGVTLDISVLVDGVASIDDGSTLKNYMADEGLNAA